MVSDGGGKRSAALRVLVGRDDIVRLYQGLAWRWRGARPELRTMRRVRINGLPGVVLAFADGPQTLALEPAPDGRIAAVYTIRNPDKLQHVASRPANDQLAPGPTG